MPAPKDPQKYKEWIVKLKSVSNTGRFEKGHKKWMHENCKKNWIKHGQHLSPRTEFKKRCGKWVTHYGYVMVYSPKHPYKNAADGVPEHRLVMEKAVGRFLNRGEVVHHVNGIKDDNRIKNLIITDKRTHAKSHWSSLTKKYANRSTS
jgi:hypothetical protein